MVILEAGKHVCVLTNYYNTPNLNTKSCEYIRVEKKSNDVYPATATIKSHFLIIEIKNLLLEYWITVQKL